jgi:hypothetical protein
MMEREHLERAEAELAQASRRLWEVRRLALVGEYDGDEFDHAVATYRTAARAVEEAQVVVGEHALQVSEANGFRGFGVQVPVAFRRAFPAVEETQDVSPALTGRASSEPFVPSPRMHFVKWLVATGRISDQ